MAGCLLVSGWHLPTDIAGGVLAGLALASWADDYEDAPVDADLGGQQRLQGRLALSTADTPFTTFTLPHGRTWTRMQGPALAAPVTTHSHCAPLPSMR